MRVVSALVALALLGAPVAAQTYKDSGGTITPGFVPVQPGVGPIGVPANPLTVSDPATAAATTPTPITASDAAHSTTPGALGFLCIATAAGNVKVGFPNGQTMTITMSVTGWPYAFPLKIDQVFVTGTTATASCWTLN